MNLTMLGMNVLVQEIKPEEKTSSGIFIPQTVTLDKSGLVKARVISVGPGEYQVGVFVKTEVKQGDEVLIDKNFCKPFKDASGTEYGLMSYRDILGIVNQA